MEGILLPFNPSPKLFFLSFRISIWSKSLLLICWPFSGSQGRERWQCSKIQALLNVPAAPGKGQWYYRGSSSPHDQVESPLERKSSMVRGLQLLCALMSREQPPLHALWMPGSLSESPCYQWMQPCAGLAITLPTTAISQITHSVVSQHTQIVTKCCHSFPTSLPLSVVRALPWKLPPAPCDDHPSPRYIWIYFPN